MKRLPHILFLLCFAVGSWAQDLQKFETAVQTYALRQNVTDYTSSASIEMPEPPFAWVNLTGFDSMPASKYTEVKGWMEVYDGLGHYFRKPVTLSAQGAYSIRYPKKNFTCHFCDELWNEENGAKLKIGRWVKQDSFHFKAFYTDFLRGIGEVGYKLFAQVVADRTPYWQRGGYDDSSTKPRCFPDGFPCAVYLNGEFYGLFAWQLKKSRKNMNMNKDVAEHIHLDGNLQDKYIFRGSISWNQFEVRNPDGLYDKNGNLYNGNSPMELIDENSRYFADETDTPDVTAAKQVSAQAKQYIKQMSKYWTELYQLEKNGATPAEMRAEIEKRYEAESLIDYCVFYYFQANIDGSLKNWQWFTYDGHRWMVTPYDLDQTFGINLYAVVRPATLPWVDLVSGPFYWIDKYYQADLRQRYAQLRDRGVFTSDNIQTIINDWYARVGENYYELEKKRWPESPCYRDAVCNDGWEVSDDWDIYVETPDYSATTTYHKGDLCKLEGRLWRATKTVRGVKPYRINANIDTIDRLRRWVEERIIYVDELYQYSPPHENTPIADVAAPSSTCILTGIYTLEGIPVSSPLPGQIYIFRYSDGTTRKVRN